MPMLEIMARCVSIADFEEERNGKMKCSRRTAGRRSLSNSPIYYDVTGRNAISSGT